MSFETRCALGLQWDNEVSTQLELQGYIIGRYNIENAAPHYKAHPNYPDAENPSIKFARLS